MVLNLWRLMRSELKLSSYTLQAVAAAVLRERVPEVGQQQMAAWFDGGPAGEGGGGVGFWEVGGGGSRWQRGLMKDLQVGGGVRVLGGGGGSRWQRGSKEDLQVRGGGHCTMLFIVFVFLQNGGKGRI